MKTLKLTLKIKIIMSLLSSRKVTLVLLSIITLSFIGQVQGYEDIIVDSKLNFNLEVGDKAVILFEQIDNETITYPSKPIDNMNETDYRNDYLRFSCVEYDEDVLFDMKTIRFSIQSSEYSNTSVPSFTSSFGWIDEESETYYVNKSIGSFFQLARVIIPNDMNCEDMFGGNMTNFVYCLTKVINQGESVMDSFKKNFESIINETVFLEDINLSDDKMAGDGKWNYQMYAWSNQTNNILTSVRLSMDVRFVLNEKRMAEEMSFDFKINATTWVNNVVYRVQLKETKTDSELVYDSRPDGIWNFDYTWIIVIAVIGGGVIAFFSFFYLKCKVNPTYSSVCKVYKKKGKIRSKSGVYTNQNM